MTLSLTEEIEAVTAKVTGRRASMFAADLEAANVGERVRGRRVLVVGGAGTIGSATTRAILRSGPRSLAVLDPAENNLAELARDIRNGRPRFKGDVTLQPIPYGSPLAREWLRAQPRFDLVLSFAALKHVRSERDHWSTTRLLETNLLDADRFLTAVRMFGHGSDGVFFVSTDKAADPISMMGASKRAMESLLLAHAGSGAPRSFTDEGGPPIPPLAHVSSARFANVAFSDGSLPWAFLQRLAKGQPLAAPGDVRRYLVSPGESGDLCLLAALAPHCHVVVPVLDQARDQFSFTAVAEALLRHRGLSPTWHTEEADAESAMAVANGTWPVLVTSSSTSGEKAEEVFVGANEAIVDLPFKSVKAVQPPTGDIDALSSLLRLIRCAVHEGVPSKEELGRALQRVVPSFHHRETGKNLDDKR